MNSESLMQPKKQGILKVIFPGEWFLIDVNVKIFVEDKLHSTHSIKQGFSTEIPITGNVLNLKIGLSFRSTKYELRDLEPEQDYTMELIYNSSLGKFGNKYNLSKDQNVIVHATSAKESAQKNLPGPMLAETSNSSNNLPENDVIGVNNLSQLAHYKILHNNLTQTISKKYRNSAIDLGNLSDEIQNYFTGRKFGYFGTVTPKVKISTAINGDKFIKASVAAAINTRGNTNKSAICVVVTKNDSEVHISCGMTGNYDIVSGRSIVGAMFTGGASLIGNVASNVKDSQHIRQVMENIDHLMHNFFNETATSGNNHVLTTSAANEMSIPEKIKQLAELKNQGILTETEFQEKKSELLSRF